MSVVITILEALIAIPRIGIMIADLVSWITKQIKDNKAKERLEALDRASQELRKVPELPEDKRKEARREAARKFRDALKI